MHIDAEYSNVICIVLILVDNCAAFKSSLVKYHVFLLFLEPGSTF
jgi:hypothetical protein